MEMKNWNVISIINLSDLCSEKMEDIGEKLNLAEKYSCKNHSIFSEARVTERDALLQGTHSKMILAWGKHASISELACNALKKLPEEQQIFGLQYQRYYLGFRHSNPMIKDRCIEWLEDMYQQLENREYQSGIAATKENENNDSI